MLTAARHGVGILNEWRGPAYLVASAPSFFVQKTGNYGHAKIHEFMS
jgi:hypothetical protein